MRKEMIDWQLEKAGWYLCSRLNHITSNSKDNALPALCTSERMQPANGEELRPFVGRTLMPSHGDATQSVLDRAFKGEL
jgi:hypothetical protein